MGNPAIGILHKNPEAELNRELLSDSDEITLTIEKESGFFSTDSWVLHEELFLARGVTQEDIESENRKFLDYLFYLDKHKSGRAQIGPTAE